MNIGIMAPKKLLLAFGAAVALLSLASAAFACTRYRGAMTFTITPTHPTSTTNTQTVVGKNGIDSSWMDWCGGEPNWDITTEKGVGIMQGQLPLDLTITSAPATTCLVGGQNKLTQGVYTVILMDGYMGAEPSAATHQNCHHQEEYVEMVKGNGQVLGSLVVDASGAGTGTYKYLSLAWPGYQNICVFDAISDNANDINIKVL